MTIIVEAVHTIRPITNTAFDHWVEWYGEVSVPAMERNGFDMIGAFQRNGGRLGQDVLLARFASVADFEKAGESLRKDPALTQGVATILSEVDLEEEVKVGAPVPYATEQRLEAALAATPDSPRQYLQAVLEVDLMGAPTAYDLIGQLADRLEGRLDMVTAYQTQYGRRNELTDIWIMPDGVNFGYRPGDPLVDLLTPLREVAPEESMYYLNPLPYSPLQ